MFRLLQVLHVRVKTNGELRGKFLPSKEVNSVCQIVKGVNIFFIAINQDIRIYVIYLYYPTTHTIYNNIKKNLVLQISFGYPYSYSLEYEKLKLLPILTYFSKIDSKPCYA